MAGKLIARKGDKHSCPLHGEGTIITGHDNYLVEGQLVARVGDKIRCPDGSEAEILDNDCCMEVGGKKVARLGDKTSHGGEIISAASTSTAQDQDDFIYFGEGVEVEIGENVFFGGEAESQGGDASTLTEFTAPDPYDGSAIYGNDTDQQQTSGTKSTDQTTNNKNEKNMWPSAEVKIYNSTSRIGPLEIVMPPYTYTGYISNTLEASLTLTKKDSVNPATFNKDGFEIEAKNEATKVVSDFNIKDARTILEEPPRLTLYNSYGEYIIELTPMVVTPQERVYAGQISKETIIYDGDWDIKGEMAIALNITFKRNESDNSWSEDITEVFDSFKAKLAGVVEESKLMPQSLVPATVVVLTIIFIAAAPVGA